MAKNYFNNPENVAKLFSDLGLHSMSYSGRFMYGKKCPAIVVKRGTSAFSVAIDIAAQIAEYAEDWDTDIREFEMALGDPKEDDYAMDYLVYWPKYVLSDEQCAMFDVDDDEDEDDED